MKTLLIFAAGFVCGALVWIRLERWALARKFKRDYGWLDGGRPLSKENCADPNKMAVDTTTSRRSAKS